jgi:hypothetical protein
MKLQAGFIVLISVAAVSAAEKPRVFITESGAAQLTGEASVADTKGSLSFTGGTSKENIEVMKAFSRLCPNVLITGNRDKADFVVRFDHEGINPTTPFVRGNKVAVFDRGDDLVYSESTRTLGTAVKGVCAALARK